MAHAQTDSAPTTAQPNGAIEWTPLTGIDHQIFPSEQISMATNPARIPFVRVKLANVSAGSKLHVTVKCESLMDDSSEDFAIEKDRPTLLLPIKVSWNFGRLARVRQQIPVNFNYSLTINGQDMGTQTDTAIVHSVND